MCFYALVTLNMEVERQNGSPHAVFIDSSLQGVIRELFVVVFDRSMVHVLRKKSVRNVSKLKR